MRIAMLHAGPVRRHVLSFAALLVVVLAGVAFGLSTVTSSEPQEASSVPNTLTRGEAAAGWRLLFDGNTTKGWHCYGRDRVVGWDVSNGELIALGQGGDRANDIVTDEEFGSFELAADWKLTPRANSGIFFHVVEQGYDAVYATGPEYQLIDDKGWPDKLESWQATAANYAMHPPSRDAANPVGEWNHARIVVNGPHVEHWLNGVKVVDYEMWTDDWHRRVQAGKWKDYPGYGKARRGKIGLQDHGNRIFFRNIKIRVL
jgi:hypothetical protein